jgi:hypothetical protein
MGKRESRNAVQDKHEKITSRNAVSRLKIGK